MKKCNNIFKYTYKITYIIYLYVLIWKFNMLQSYDAYTLNFMSDVNPYSYQIISSALDHKGGSKFSVVVLY